MTATADPQQATAPKKGSKLPMILGLVLAVVGGAGGFYAVQSGLLSFGGDDAEAYASGEEGYGSGEEGYASGEEGSSGSGHESAAAAGAEGGDSGSYDLPDLGSPSFVALDPIIVNLPPGSRHDILRFSATLDVPDAYIGEVQSIRPRIVDVLNSYLRAVEVSDLEDRAALTLLRSQMLRRVQVVTGEGRVRDLLINEFVFN